MLPAIVLMQTEIDLHEWPPLRPLGLADKVQAGFLRGSVGLQGIALNTGANNILPTGWTASVTRDYMVQIQILALASFAAVLAGVLVTLEDVVACKLDFLLRQMVIDQ